MKQDRRSSIIDKIEARCTILDMAEPAEVLGGASSSIRALLRKHFPPKTLPPKPDLPRPLWTGVVDFSTY